jgi:hypothetical protein
MAANPTTNAPLPTPTGEQIDLMKGAQLVAVAEAHGITIPTGTKVAGLRVLLKEKFAPQAILTVVPNADDPIIAEHPEGATPVLTTIGVKVEPDGYPADSADIAKLSDAHLASLKVDALATVDPEPANPGPLTRTQLIAWLQRTAYQVPGQSTIDDHTTAEPHIPTASPAPTTVPTMTGDEIRNSDGLAQPEDGAPEDVAPAQDTSSIVEVGDNFSLFLAGEKPIGSFLNVAAVRVDLLGQKLTVKDGDRVRISFEVDLDEFAVKPVREGGKKTHRIRTITGDIDKTSVEVTLAS